MFGATLFSILVAYANFMFAWFVLLCVSCLVLFRLLFQSKRPAVHCFIFILLGICIFQYVGHKILVQTQLYESGFTYKDKTKKEFKGVIEEFPSYRYTNSQYVVRLENSETRILVTAHPHQKFSYLETISLVGSISDIRTQGKEWLTYYQKLGVHYTTYIPVLSSTHSEFHKSFGQKVMLKIFEFKMFVRQQSLERFSSHASALFLGMLLGEKDELSKDEKTMFNAAGLSHILVVSGYNISLLITFIFLLLKFADKYVRIVCALGLIFLFVLLVGADGSVVRAALMGSIIVFAKLTRRTSNALNVLFVAVTIMLIYKPFSVFDAGLHLSFIATFSLLILPEFKRIPEFILTTIWVFLFVSPYIVYLSGHISLGGIMSNVLVIFLLPTFMLVSLVSLASFVLHLRLWIDSFVLDVMSRYVFLVAEFSQIIPRIEIKTSPSVTAMFYVILISSILFFKNRYTTFEFIEKHYQKFVPQKPS